MFSSRLPWGSPENALAALARGPEVRPDFVDLTETNPTRVAIDYPSVALGAALARASGAPYVPTPFGLPAARGAVSAEYARNGITVDPERIVLTASSSESYGFLFKLLADPGDAVLVPEPSYPLFDYLARLEGVVPIAYRLAFDGRWHLDGASLDEGLRTARARGARPRAIVVVNPNNPTGSFLKRDELARLAKVCADNDLALVSDEVFSLYETEPDATRVKTVSVEPLMQNAAPAFSLGGLSKACGLPQLKLGWIVVGGRRAAESLAGLELIADTYLSVGTPVQAALPKLFLLGAGIRAAIAARVDCNRAALATALPPASSCSLLPAEGGWSAILRLPATRTDEAWAAALLREAGVLVHPGYFFDLSGGAYLVLSLLPAPDRFGEAVRRLVALADTNAG